jgi:hypothetical protein
MKERPWLFCRSSDKCEVGESGLMKNCLLASVVCLIIVGCGAGGSNLSNDESGDSGDPGGVDTPGTETRARENQAGGPARWDLQRKPAAWLPAGTRFGEEPPAGWSDILLLAVGRAASGDVSAASAGVHEHVRMFTFVILANAERDESNRYCLEKVGVGFSMKINGKNTVVTREARQQIGANLGIVALDVLARHEETLAGIRQVARNSSSMIIDVPTLMLHRGDHREMIVRYLIRVSPSTGRVCTAVWLLDRGKSDQDYLVVKDTVEDTVEDTFQLLPPNMLEDRILNVKGDRFTLGIPMKDAFGQVRTAQGTACRFSKEARKYAGRATFTKASYGALLSSLSTTALR